MALSRNEVFIRKVLKRLYAETSSSPVHDSSGKEEAVLINLGSKSKENDLENVQALSADASTSSGTLSKSSRGSAQTPTEVGGEKENVDDSSVSLTVRKQFQARDINRGS